MIGMSIPGPTVITDLSISPSNYLLQIYLSKNQESTRRRRRRRKEGSIKITHIISITRENPFERDRNRTISGPKDWIFNQKTRENLTNPLWVFQLFFLLENGSCREIK
jgi:hypothetical protein